MVTEGFDFRSPWVVHFGSCLMAELASDFNDRQAEGFIAALMVRGCRRVSGAICKLDDAAAADFARHYAAALKKHAFGQKDRSPHAFAIALKDAITALRQQDGGKYDHEYYWAPLVLYGLG